jgi:hypothetical protein
LLLMSPYNKMFMHVHLVTVSNINNL